MNGENRPPVTDEPVIFENLPPWVKTSGKLPIILEDSVEHTSLIKKIRKITTYNQLDLEILGSR